MTERQGRSPRGTQTDQKRERDKEGREEKTIENKAIIVFYTTQCFITYTVLSHTLLQAGRENPADRWGNRGIQANQPERGKVANQKKKLECSLRQLRERQNQEKNRERGKERRETQDRVCNS